MREKKWKKKEIDNKKMGINTPADVISCK